MGIPALLVFKDGKQAIKTTVPEPKPFIDSFLFEAQPLDKIMAGVAAEAREVRFSRVYEITIVTAQLKPTTEQLAIYFEVENP